MNTDAKPLSNRAVGAVAATASTVALACGVCCVLPLAIPAAMLGSVGGILAWFASAHQWITPIAIVAVIAGWLWLGYQSKQTGKRPGRATLFVMGFATVMMALAYMWPLFESLILSMLRR